MFPKITDDHKVANDTVIDLTSENKTVLPNDISVSDAPVEVKKEEVKIKGRVIPRFINARRRKRKMQKLARKISRGNKNAKSVLCRLQRKTA